MSISRMSRGGARRPSCFIRDTNGQALAYAYFEDEPGRRAAAKPLTRDEAGASPPTSLKLQEMLSKGLNACVLFDHLVGACQQCLGHGYAHRFSGLEVDH
jgi:hypothetical protein